MCCCNYAKRKLAVSECTRRLQQYGGALLPSGLVAGQRLRNLHELSTTWDSPRLVQAFIHCIGIFLSGLMGLLQSRRLGVVTQQHEGNLLKPTVNVFFSTDSNTYISPQKEDLSKSS
jgi:hypothetical protein